MTDSFVDVLAVKERLFSFGRSVDELIQNHNLARVNVLLQNGIVEMEFNLNTLNTFWMNKENGTRTGFEPATSGLTCRCSTN